MRGGLRWLNYIGAYLSHWDVIYGTGCSLNIVFLSRIFNILRPLLRQHLAVISCTKNGQPIRVTVHSPSCTVELLFYMLLLGMDCSELGKNTILNEHPVLVHPLMQTFFTIQPTFLPSRLQHGPHMYIYLFILVFCLIPVFILLCACVCYTAIQWLVHQVSHVSAQNRRGSKSISRGGFIPPQSINAFFCAPPSPLSPPSACLSRRCVCEEWHVHAKKGLDQVGRRVRGFPFKKNPVSLIYLWLKDCIQKGMALFIYFLIQLENLKIF